MSCSAEICAHHYDLREHSELSSQHRGSAILSLTCTGNGNQPYARSQPPKYLPTLAPDRSSSCESSCKISQRLHHSHLRRNRLRVSAEAVRLPTRGILEATAMDGLATMTVEDTQASTPLLPF